MLLLQGVQTGGGSTVISWVVDDDNSVVKYCQNNIVTIYVPGDSDTGADNDNDDEADDIPGLAIVAHNTLRLRIVPCDPDYLGTVHIKYLNRQTAASPFSPLMIQTCFMVDICNSVFIRQ